MDRHAEMIRFGNDGWKTRYDDGFTAENAARVADAIGVLWADGHEGATVYVGYDTRRDSCDVAQNVAGILASYGLKVKLSDAACPTPAVSWACAQDGASVGAVVVTASELSCDYGGIIVRGADGGPCSREFLDDIEQAVPGEAPADRASYDTCDFVSAYVDHLKQLVDGGAIRARAPRVVVDPMYGASGGIVSAILRDLGCDVVEIHQKSLGDFGGIHPAPTDPWADECEQTVAETGSDLGLVLDCDADRAALVDETGRLLAVRELVPLVIRSLVARGAGETRVVSTLTSSALIERQAEQLGLAYTPVSVGFTYIYDEMGEGDVLLGSEEYGGICIPSHLRERDGIYACLLAIEALCRSGNKLSELVERQDRELGHSCWLRRDVRIDAASAEALRNILPGVNPPEIAGKKPAEVSHADGLRLGFDDGSWVLVRQARTEPIVRVYAEAADAASRDALMDAARDLVSTGAILS
ncbi:phosphoglucomutase [Paratractidigestivibacter sp.]|uniref:phosphoglucomutase n=2 Tax=Paratractidigestivibacter sp. TaxID=2847316 RepID=UPI002AC9B11D|nr:phosphoglucomutase [Paratractidigestivibacter sp.]